MADAPDFNEDEGAAAFRAFRRMARAIVEDAPALRAAVPASAALRSAAAAALEGDEAGGAAFFAERFTLRPLAEPAFLTGYYEPVVPGSLTPSPDFPEPILARPPDLVSFAPGEGPAGFDPALAGGRRRADGALEPYPARAEIEAAGERPIVWLRDAVEAFLIHVQGSARVALPDGRQMRLVYAGRNGRPYTSIGRLLIDGGAIPEHEMSLARLKGWLRENGPRPGEPARDLMRRNASFIFFRLEEARDPCEGPIGGAGLPLVALRSIAVDRTRWSYGAPFWIEADLPEGPLRRLMIAEDTGSAIVGEARFDLFCGTGDEAGERAGAIRHPARAFALEPREAAR